MQKLTGTDPNTLDYHLMEFFAPGEKVGVILGLNRELSDEEILSISRSLSDQGMTVNKIQAGRTPEWPNALQVVFTRPHRSRGIAAIPLNNVINSSLAMVGAPKIVGWTMSRG